MVEVVSLRRALVVLSLFQMRHTNIFSLDVICLYSDLHRKL